MKLELPIVMEIRRSLSSVRVTAFVTDPGKVTPGNKMDYDGTGAATARAVAEYRVSLK